MGRRATTGSTKYDGCSAGHILSNCVPVRLPFRNHHVLKLSFQPDLLTGIIILVVVVLSLHLTNCPLDEFLSDVRR